MYLITQRGLCQMSRTMNIIEHGDLLEPKRACLNRCNELSADGNVVT